MAEVINSNDLKEKLNSLIQETMMEEKKPDLDHTRLVRRKENQERQRGNITT